MKKKGWPWIGNTQNEMGGSPSKGTVLDRKEDSPNPLDSLTPEKSVLEDSGSSMQYQEGIISPLNMAKDFKKIDIINEEGKLATFSCKVANSLQEKIAGLQPYSNLDESAGLIFNYSKPEDVLYHMGTVKFPIDILFIDNHFEIKKIYKNIQPGTLGTFGCANVLRVLEICGGLSDRLGIKQGDFYDEDAYYNVDFNKISKSLGFEKDLIIKYSNLENTKFSSWKNYLILNINDKIIKKSSNESEKFISNLTLQIKKNKKINLCVFDFDDLIEKSGQLAIYKTESINNDLDVPVVLIDGTTAKISNANFRIENFYNLPDNLKQDENIISSLTKSFSGFLSSNDIIIETNKMLNEFRKLSRKSSNKLVVVSRHQNSKFVESIISNKLKLNFGENFKFETFSIPKNADAIDIIEFCKKIYGSKDIKIFGGEGLIKRSGIPISNEVKMKARRACKFLAQASDLAEKSLENMQKNLKEYEKIKDKPEIIKNTKGQYNQSVKSNTKVIRELLIKIRDSIKILHEIKDISTTIEIIDVLTISAKITSEAIETIFDLIEQIDSQDFYIILKEKVEQYTKVIEDLKSSIERGNNYLNENILGITVLSE